MSALIITVEPLTGAGVPAHITRASRAADRGVSVHTRALGAPLRGVGSAAADVAAVATAGGKRPSRSQLY